MRPCRERNGREPNDPTLTVSRAHVAPTLGDAWGHRKALVGGDQVRMSCASNAAYHLIQAQRSGGMTSLGYGDDGDASLCASAIEGRLGATLREAIV